jgi:hypothetical protein
VRPHRRTSGAPRSTRAPFALLARAGPVWLAGLVVLATLAVAACGSGLASPAPSGGATPAVPLGTLGPPGGEESAAASSPLASGGEAVVVDPTLLGILPQTVDGIAMVESAEGESAALKDPNLTKVASAVASGLAIDAATGEFVYVFVVRLMPGALDDTGYRSWRDSYDEGACSQASGVTGHAETTIGGRTVYIGTCAGGVRTYHVRLDGPGLLISASAVGEQRRLGEKLVEALRP